MGSGELFESKKYKVEMKSSSGKRIAVKICVGLGLFCLLGLAFTGVVTFLFDTLKYGRSESINSGLWQVGLGVGGFILAVAVLNYLQPTQIKNSVIYSSSDSVGGNPEAVGIFNERLSGLEDKFDSFLSQNRNGDVSRFLSVEEKQQLKELLINRLSDQSQVDLLSGIERNILSKWQLKQAEEVFQRTVNRLERELIDQARRGNVNLVLGMLTTLTGVGILSYSVFQAPDLQNTMSMISHFLPRLSLVILVEVFAYFFLKLYKQGLVEIKYFQNEITNIESKYLALNVSTSRGIEEGMLKAIGTLLMTERNFILEKGQSTVDLEYARSEQASTDSLVEKLAKLIDAAKK